MSRKKSRKRNRRRVLLEHMEKRLPLAGHFAHNFLMPGDVNDDHLVTASDALAIINDVSRRAASDRGAAAESESVDTSIRSMYTDVNDDGHSTTLDALQVVNELTRQSESSGRSDAATAFLEGEGTARSRVELESEDNGKVELDVRLVDAPANQLYDVTIGGEVLGRIQTNDLGRGHLELEYGGNDPPVPAVLADANESTTVVIGNVDGDIVNGTFGTVGEISLSDSGSDGSSDQPSDGASDGSSDDLNDDSSDDDVVAAASSDDSSASSDDNSVSDSGDDGLSDADPDALSDAASDGSSDGLNDDSSDDDSSDDDSSDDDSSDDDSLDDLPAAVSAGGSVQGM